MDQSRDHRGADLSDGTRAGINLSRLYEFRFRNVDQRVRIATWREISSWLYTALGSPERVLDPAAGRGEFINAVPAAERWIVDVVEHTGSVIDAGVRVVVGDIFQVELPAQYFNGVLVSNFLEHLESPDAIAAFLGRMRTVIAPGGRIAIMGPNFRYAAKQYFDCADHILPLTHNAVAEHLFAAGFDVDRVVPRFVPYSFQSRLPVRAGLVRAYLRIPALWRVFGQQFVVLGRVPATGE